MSDINLEKRLKLINQYEDRLMKVKIMHNPNNTDCEIIKARCFEFIKFAEEQLEEVKNGREW